MPDIDIEKLNSWTGKSQSSRDSIAVFPAQALAAALDHENPPREGDELPGLWQWIYFLDTPKASRIGTDGHPAGSGFLPHAPLPRRMWAAGNVQFRRPLIIGKTAHKISTINSIDYKKGRSGKLLFVNVGHEIFQDDILCIAEEQNIVYREMPAGPAKLPAGKKPGLAPDFARPVTPDPVLLFRYSALTYNGHRIHYDRDYAVNAEHYPALLVHAPLIATLLMDLVRTEAPSASVTEFSFRAVRPTFDTHPFQLQGSRDAGVIHLWTVNNDGYTGVSATAKLA